MKKYEVGFKEDGTLIVFTVINGISVVYNPFFDGDLPQEVQEEINRAKKLEQVRKFLDDKT